MSINSKAKFAIFEAYGWKCQICHCEMVYNPTANHTSNSARIDHIVPVHKGGKDKKNNLSAVCQACNAKKKHYSSREYLDTASFDPLFLAQLIQYERKNGVNSGLSESDIKEKIKAIRLQTDLLIYKANFLSSVGDLLCK